MPKGKDPETADGLGGVHNVSIPRQPVVPPGGEREPRAEERDLFPPSEPAPADREPLSGRDGAET